MEPIRDTHATLVDLLDRILDQGLVINADIIVSVAGIPLLGVNLKAALAGMETMLKYGIMQAWDERTRAWEREHRKKKEPSLASGEEVIQQIFGSYYYTKGIYTTWRSGYFYLTTKRLLLFHQDFGEVLFEAPFEAMKGFSISKNRHFTGEEKKELCLLLNHGEVARLHTKDVFQLKETIEKRMQTVGLDLEESPSLAQFDEKAVSFLSDDEEVTHQGKIWYLMSLSASDGIMGDTWKPGHLYLTNERLCWWYNFDGRVAIEVPVDKITGAAIEIRDLKGLLKRKKVLSISYEYASKHEACFSGDEEEMQEWEKVITEIISKQGMTAVEDDMETCPKCERRAPVKELLEKGCPRCKWVSPRLKKAKVVSS